MANSKGQRAKQMAWPAAVLLLLLAGCAGVQTSADVPNLECVDAGRNVWRSGQPTAAGFARLATLGVTNALKLDEASEGADTPRGTLIDCPISVEQQLGLAPLGQERLESAVCCLRRPGTVVHCLHGQDRTGLVVAIYRVEVQGWSVAAAEREMLAHGFHRELLGLWDAWEDFKETRKR